MNLQVSSCTYVNGQRDREESEKGSSHNACHEVQKFGSAAGGRAVHEIMAQIPIMSIIYAKIHHKISEYFVCVYKLSI